MEAIVLAGGLGTRLRGIVPDLPKPMAPVAGRPFLEVVLSTLARKGFSRIILSLGYQANTITSYFGLRYLGMELAYEVEDSPLGTGGAIRQALIRCRSDHVFVFNGDTYLDLEVPQVEAVWQRDHIPLIVARSLPDTGRYGRLITRGKEVLGFAEKGGSGPGLINAGCYVLPVTLLERFKLGQAFSFEVDFLEKSVGVLPIDFFLTAGDFIDIGVPEDYLRAQTELAGIVN